MDWINIYNQFTQSIINDLIKNSINKLIEKIKIVYY